MFRIGKEEADAVARVIEGRSLFRIGSKYQETNNFEKELKEKFGSNHCVCVNSGTSALIAGLAALGVGPGDEVIVPAYTFIATAVAVLAVGAIPVLADIDETMTIDANDVERKISKFTKACIPVNIQGFPCNMDKLVELSKKYGFYIVEDACQADGGSYKGKRLGTIGEIGAYSFNDFKIMSAGEGGALVTNDLKLYERAILYHDCGAAFWTYDRVIEEPLFTGANMRVSDVTGAILRVQLKRLDGILSDLRRIKKRMMSELSDVDGIKFNPSNDIEGDCATTLPFLFDTVEEAMAFEIKIGGNRPINTGKHVYVNWSPVLEKRGAHCDSLNPYLNPKNAALNMDVDKYSCKKSLDILSRTVYMMLNPDWSEDYVSDKIKLCKK